MTVEKIKLPHHGRCVDATVYVPDGAGNFPFVIISHGYNGHGDDLAPLARSLADGGIGAVTFTFCGGSTRDKSGFPTEDMTIFTECEDLDAVIDSVRAIGAGRLVLFGESQGGLVTAMTAERRADDIAAMCLLYPALCIPDNWRERFPHTEDIPEVVDFWGMRLGRGFFVTLRDVDTCALGGNYTRPVLIMQGDADVIVMPEYSVRAAAQYKNAQLEIFPGEGHGFSPCGAARMAGSVASFVRRNV